MALLTFGCGPPSKTSSPRRWALLAVSPRGIHGRAEQPTGLGFRRSADSSTEELYDKIAVCTLRPGRFLIRDDLILGSTLALSLSSAHRHDTGRTAQAARTHPLRRRTSRNSARECQRDARAAPPQHPLVRCQHPTEAAAVARRRDTACRPPLRDQFDRRSRAHLKRAAAARIELRPLTSQPSRLNDCADTCARSRHFDARCLQTA